MLQSSGTADSQKITISRSHTITRGDGRSWKNYEVTLQEFSQIHTQFRIINDHTASEYHELRAELSDLKAKVDDCEQEGEKKENLKKKRNDCRKRIDSIKDGPAVFYGTLQGDRKKKKDILFRSAVVFDLDHITTDHEKKLRERLQDTMRMGLRHYAFYLFPSTSYTADEPRYRLVFPFSKNVSVDVYFDVFTVIRKLILNDIPVDESTDDEERAFYLPACFPDNEDQIKALVMTDKEAQALDPDSFLNVYKATLDGLKGADPMIATSSSENRKQVRRNSNKSYTKKTFTSVEDMPDKQRAKLRKVAGYLRANGVPIRSAIIDDSQVKIGIVCPWFHEHTADSGNTETVVIIHPDDGPPGFDCKHSHCAGRGWSDVLRRFGSTHGMTFITAPDGDQDPLSAVLPAVVSDRERREYIGGSVVVVHTGTEIMKKENRQIMKQLYEVAYCRRSLIVPTGWSAPDDWGEFFRDSLEKGRWDWAPWLKLHKPTNADPEVYPTGLREGPLSEALAHNSDYLILNGGDHPIAYFYDNQGKYSYSYSITEKLKAFMPSHLWSASVFGQCQKLFHADATKQVSFDSLNADEQFINLKNGLLDVKTLASDQGPKLIQHGPEHLFTSQLSFSYDPTAECPLWLSFIDDCCRDRSGKIDEDLRDLIQELFGYTLSNLFGYRLKAAVFLFSRRGNTGKSVILSVLRGMIGINNSVSISLRALGGTGGESRWITSSMYGKRLTICPDEGGAVKMESDERFKSLTGADPVAAERKGADLFTFVYPGIIWTAGNSLPVFRGKGDHLIDRMIIIPFENTIPEDQRDPELSDKLRAEYPGIFNWGMKGLKRVTDDNGRFKGISSLTQSDKRKKATEAYRSQSDTLYSFFRISAVSAGTGALIRKTEFEQDYFMFCSAVDSIPVSKRHIKMRMESYGIGISRRDTLYYKNLKWSDLWFEAKSRCTSSNGQLDPMKLRDFLEEHIDLDLYDEEQDE